eukprot:4784413-Pyramimonas_sp.AAC.1
MVNGDPLRRRQLRMELLEYSWDVLNRRNRSEQKFRRNLWHSFFVTPTLVYDIDPTGPEGLHFWMEPPACRSRQDSKKISLLLCGGTTMWSNNIMWTRRRCWRLSMLVSIQSRKSSEVFSSTLDTWHEHYRAYPAAQIQSTSWNGRALLHHKPEVRRKKFRKLATMCRRQAIICLQEVHGTLEELKHQCYLHRINGAVLESVPQHDSG